MKPRKIQETTAAYIRALMERKMLPRNQLATLSGLSNTYIHHLEKGHIANVDRVKLIAFAVALNLDLDEIDELLTVFDRAKLTKDDIPSFIQSVGQRKNTGALLPLTGSFTYELHMMFSENIPGPYTIVYDLPTANILPEGFRTFRIKAFKSRSEGNPHSLLYDLVEAIGQERQRNFTYNLAQYRVDQYICKDCLEKYITEFPNSEESEWRFKHLKNLIRYIENFENFHFHPTETCSRFNFAFKLPDPASLKNVKLFFLGKAAHSSQWASVDHLIGFTTDNQWVIQNFRENLEVIKGKTVKELEKRSNLLDYLENLIS
jgi:transcriptional regulator with XRE-family HTH domain